MKKNILVTGASGNVGYSVIRFLSLISPGNQIIVGIRDLQKAKAVLSDFPDLEYTHLDFEDPSTCHNALENIDIVFLLRPPHISDVQQYIAPFIKEMNERNIKEIVFLSVQGAEKTRMIPHSRIEKLILDHNMDHIFIRPSYFMQNLLTTLINDVKERQNIVLPAGKTTFNWVDAENVGEVAAILLNDFSRYKNQTYEVTGYENKNFYEVARQLSEVTKRTIKYTNMNPVSFFKYRKKEGMKKEKILVLIMLHFFPRFQKQPAISSFYEHLTGKKPTKLQEFIEREKTNLIPDIP